MTTADRTSVDGLIRLTIQSTCTVQPERHAGCTCPARTIDDRLSCHQTVFDSSLGPRLHSRDLRFDLLDSVSHHAVDDSSWDCESIEY
ncbi:hypothetical protein ACFC3F_11805 [Microbacterium sp. NPDC055910]|uniref:hypothetical protein n=1 Tax=Microbacterium sp. NPDC055910 TaxID=3345659 RepID=UPI0035D9F716